MPRVAHCFDLPVPGDSSLSAEALYGRLPVFAQNAAASWHGWRLRRRRFGGEFRRVLAGYVDREHWAPVRVAAFRDERLRAFVAAAAKVRYYRDLFARHGVAPEDVRTLADLERLPVLDKSTVRQIAGGLAAAAPPGPRLVCRTSGSTGAGLEFPATRRAEQEQYAVWWRYRLALRIGLATPCLYLGGRQVVPARQRQPPFWRYNRASRQILFSAYHLSGATAPAYLAEMRRVGAAWLHGYPSMVALLASYALQLGQRLPLKWVTLAAENVLASQRDVIRTAFGVTPAEHYGLAEAVASCSECPHGRLHVDEDFAAVEFLPLGGDAFRVVGTNLSNPAFPLLRYDTGDVATVTGTVCGCGRPGRVVDVLDGRREDYVLTRTGRRLGRLDHIFKGMANIREAQIRQVAPGRMTLAVVRGNGYGSGDERRLRQAVSRRVGREMAFDVAYVDALPRTANGKLRFVTSTLADGAIDAPRVTRRGASRPAGRQRNRDMAAGQQAQPGLDDVPDPAECLAPHRSREDLQ